MVKKENGRIEMYHCFADSKEHAEQKISKTWGNLVKVQAFSWNIQYM